MAMSSFNIQTNVEVHAEQLEEDRAIITPRGSENGQAGDWEVLFPDGDVRRMTDEEWQEAQGKGPEEAAARGIDPADNREGATTESANEDRGNGDEKDSEEETETPEKPPRSSKTKVSDDKF